MSVSVARRVAGNGTMSAAAEGAALFDFDVGDTSSSSSSNQTRLVRLDAASASGSLNLPCRSRVGIAHEAKRPKW